MPALIEAYRAGLFGRRHWLNNLVAGVIVGIVALPLAMAFAIASGAKPEQGIYTAIIAGFASAALGGSRLQISGPTGAFIVILAGVTAKYGIAGLQLATLMAGVILVAMGLARLGNVIKFIPEPVIVGFTTGIGLIIWVGQWKDFFGLQVTHGGDHFHEKLAGLLLAFPTLHVATFGLAALSLAILLLAPRVKALARVPAPLIALVVATLTHRALGLEGVATIGSAFGGIPQALPSFRVPDLSLSDVVRLIGPAFTIALLGAIESLLSAVVADGMAGTRHRSNQELVGQGIGNILSPLFGGFAATGAIARTATNIRNGATSPLSGMVHAATLLVIVISLAPLAAYIPLCVLAAILFVVAYNMSELHHFLHLLRRAPRSDVAVLLITFSLTVLADLVIAVNVGVVIAALLFMRRMARAVQVAEAADAVADGNEEPPIAWPAGTMVYAINGPFFFGAAEKLEQTLESIQAHQKVLVLRMAAVPFVDATGISALAEMIDDCARRGTRVLLCELPEAVRGKLARAGLLERLGADAVFPTAAAACRFLHRDTHWRDETAPPRLDAGWLAEFHRLSTQHLLGDDGDDVDDLVDAAAAGPVRADRADAPDARRGAATPTVLIAAAIAVRDGRVLVVEERVGDALRFNHPAGKVEPGESLADAAVRECAEESGYRFTPTGVVGVYRWHDAADGVDYLRVAFAGHVDATPQAPLDAATVAVHWLDAPALAASADRHRSPVVLACSHDALAGNPAPLSRVREVMALTPLPAGA